MRNVTNMKSGIAVAGSILVDNINEISAYPQAGELTKIRNVQKSVGGCVPNVAIDLKRICPNLTVKAVGKVGADENGEYVRNVLFENGVDITALSFGKDKTSFTEVMSVMGGQRTFFTYAGASADFGANDVPMSALNVKMLHLGYFLLRDKIDNGDGELLLKKAEDFYTRPEEAEAFCKATGIDALAIAFGTAHGFYSAQPKLDFDVVKNCAKATGLPLVMHGGSGVSEEGFKKAIENGSTNYLHDVEYAAMQAMKEDVKKAITIFSNK